jgi:hypothetical protein
MLMEILEFIICPDGLVQEDITNVVGVSCQKMSVTIKT